MARQSSRNAIQATLLAAAFLLASGAGSVAQDAPAPQTCTLSQLASLDMHTETDGEIAIPVTVNDRPVEFIVDTASVYSSITSETADALGVKRKRTLNGGTFLNNVPADEFALLDTFGIGQIRSSGKWPVLIVPDKLVPVTIAGLLGPDVMKNYDVELDFFRGKFNLFVHNPCPGHAVYWTHDAYAATPMTVDRNMHVVVKAMLDGKPVSVTLDTGSTASGMSLEAARELFGWDENDPRLVSLGSEKINGGAPVQLHKFPFASLSFEGISVANPQIDLIPQSQFTTKRDLDANIILGIGVLRQLHIYLAYDEGMVYLTGAEAH